MSIAEWLGERVPAPPEALLRRLREALGAEASRDASEAAEACLSAGERLLGTVLREDEASRDYALDLLAADALVTYAFEAASVEPSSLSSRAARATVRIASLGMTQAAGSASARA